jgi:CRP-like cAMP-binding protein
MSKTPVKWTPAPERPAFVSELAELYRNKVTPADIAVQLGVSRGSVYRWLHMLAAAGEIEPAGEEKTA